MNALTKLHAQLAKASLRFLSELTTDEGSVSQNSLNEMHQVLQKFKDKNFQLNDIVRVIGADDGYAIYNGMVGRVVKIFEVAKTLPTSNLRCSGKKVHIEFPKLLSEIHGQLWQPLPLEIFVERIEKI